MPRGVAALRGLEKLHATILSRFQMEFIMAEYEEGYASRAARDPGDKSIKSGVNPDNIRKWKVLQVSFLPLFF